MKTFGEHEAAAKTEASKRIARLPTECIASGGVVFYAFVPDSFTGRCRDHFRMEYLIGGKRASRAAALAHFNGAEG